MLLMHVSLHHGFFFHVPPLHMHKRALPFTLWSTGKSLVLIAAGALCLVSFAYAAGSFANGDAAINVLGQNDDNVTRPGPYFGKGNANDGTTNRLGFFIASVFFTITPS
jgi:hypothetical protein